MRFVCGKFTAQNYEYSFFLLLLFFFCRETQAKFAKDRTAFVENHFGLFCQTFGSMTRKIARMRDKGMHAIKVLNIGTDRSEQTVPEGAV